MTKTALFVGTFDPFHLGHIWQIKRTYKFKKFDKLIIAVSKKSPNKPDAINYKHRLELTKLAIQGINFPFKVEVILIKDNTPAEVYRYIKSELKNEEVFRTLGSDSTIHDFRDGAKDLDKYLKVDYVIGVRNLWNLDKLEQCINSLSPKIKSKFSYEIMPAKRKNNLTATRIRNTVSKSYKKGLINKPQIQYIKAHSLYGK
jgi:nicotinate (nicotinamide) nucleotide adenylyltransferase